MANFALRNTWTTPKRRPKNLKKFGKSSFGYYKRIMG